MFVGGDLISVGNHQLKLLVKIIKVHYKVARAGRDEVSFRVDREVQVVAFIGEEG